MEKVETNSNMSFEELVNAIKSLTMFVNNGWDGDNIAEDASSDFDSIVTIGMVLDAMKLKFESEHTLKDHYRTRMIEEFEKRRSLEEKLQKINELSSGI